jgi:hypothetical protein
VFHSVFQKLEVNHNNKEESKEMYQSLEEGIQRGFPSERKINPEE